MALAHATLDAIEEPSLLAPWTLLRDGVPIATMPEPEAISRYVVRHMVHHRGQLTVYLRLCGVPVPAHLRRLRGPPPAPARSAHVRPPLASRVAAGVAGGLLLVALAIGNAAGYRYGVSDQAFYLPSILRAGDPALYPRDAALLDAQGRLMVSDEITAWVVTQTGLPLEWLFVAAHVASLALLFGAVWLLARRFAAHRWTAVACCLAVTLRHRITETGANTFEGYYHPRGLAFALGAAAAAALARERLGLAWILVSRRDGAPSHHRPLVGAVAGRGDGRDVAAMASLWWSPWPRWPRSWSSRCWRSRPWPIDSA